MFLPGFYCAGTIAFSPTHARRLRPPHRPASSRGPQGQSFAFVPRAIDIRAKRAVSRLPKLCTPDTTRSVAERLSNSTLRWRIESSAQEQAQYTSGEFQALKESPKIQRGYVGSCGLQIPRERIVREVPVIISVKRSTQSPGAIRA